MPVLAAATENAIVVRVCLPCMTDCQYDGSADPLSVVHVAKALNNMGCYEISPADTLGSGISDQVARMIDEVLKKILADILTEHCHDTNCCVLKNIVVSLEKRLLNFDFPASDLEGCPYASRATGNVTGEFVFEMVEIQGSQKGFDMEELSEVVTFDQKLM